MDIHIRMWMYWLWRYDRAVQIATCGCSDEITLHADARRKFMASDVAALQYQLQERGIRDMFECFDALQAGADMDRFVAAYRKLREGITSTHIVNNFAIRGA